MACRATYEYENGVLVVWQPAWPMVRAVDSRLRGERRERLLAQGASADGGTPGERRLSPWERRRAYEGFASGS